MIATEQAPQSPSAQPSFEPVRPLRRSQSSSVTFGETESIETSFPFSRNSIAFFMFSGEYRPLACSSRQPAANSHRTRFLRMSTEQAFGKAAECCRLAACAPQSIESRASFLLACLQNLEK